MSNIVSYEKEAKFSYIEDLVTWRKYKLNNKLICISSISPV